MWWRYKIIGGPVITSRRICAHTCAYLRAYARICAHTLPPIRLSPYLCFPFAPARLAGKDPNEISPKHYIALCFSPLLQGAMATVRRILGAYCRRIPAHTCLRPVFYKGPNARGLISKQFQKCSKNILAICKKNRLILFRNF